MTAKSRQAGLEEKDGIARQELAGGRRTSAGRSLVPGMRSRTSRWTPVMPASLQRWINASRNNILSQISLIIYIIRLCLDLDNTSSGHTELRKF